MEANGQRSSMVVVMCVCCHSPEFVCLHSLRSFVAEGLDTQEAQNGVCEKFRASLFQAVGVGYRRQKVRHPVTRAQNKQF